MKNLVQYCLFILVGITVGLVVIRFGSEASMLRTVIAVTEQNDTYCKEIRGRDSALTQLEDEVNRVKDALEASVVLNTTLTNEIEGLHKTIDQQVDLLRVKDQLIAKLMEEVSRLRKLLEPSNGPTPQPLPPIEPSTPQNPDSKQGGTKQFRRA